MKDLYQQDLVEMIERESRNFQLWTIGFPSHPDFAEAYELLWNEFGPHGGMERIEAVRSFLLEDPYEPTSAGTYMRYFLLVAKDEQGKLRVGAAVGVGDGTEDRVAALVEAGVDVLIVDTAHGHAQGVLERVRWVKRTFPDVEVIGGNAATAEVLAAANLAEARWLFVAIPQSFEAGQVVSQARALNPSLEIIARAHSDAEQDYLAGHGATHGGDGRTRDGKDHAGARDRRIGRIGWAAGTTTPARATRGAEPLRHRTVQGL